MDNMVSIFTTSFIKGMGKTSGALFMLGIIYFIDRKINEKNANVTSNAGNAGNAGNVTENFTFNQFKDISYNFINSYEEVKRVCKLNTYNKLLNPNGTKISVSVISDPISLFILIKIFITCIKDINEYFDGKKVGKKVTKKEKLELTGSITNEKNINIFIDIIYDYFLFEVDIDAIVKENDYTDEYIKKNYKKIDLRVFKRFLNIFTFDDSHKIFKSNVETCIQYKILEKLSLHLKNNKNVKNIHSVESLTTDLEDIWKM